MNANAFKGLTKGVLGETRKVRITLKNGQHFFGFLFDAVGTPPAYGVTYTDRDGTFNAYFEADEVACVGWEV